MSGLLQIVATSRAVISQALRALGSAPLSSKICAVDKLPPAALNIRGVIPGVVTEQHLLITHVLIMTMVYMNSWQERYPTPMCL